MLTDRFDEISIVIKVAVIFKLLSTWMNRSITHHPNEMLTVTKPVTVNMIVKNTSI